MALKSATSLQILDSNGENLSAATSLESLYYDCSVAGDENKVVRKRLASEILFYKEGKTNSGDDIAYVSFSSEHSLGLTENLVALNVSTMKFSNMLKNSDIIQKIQSSIGKYNTSIYNLSTFVDDLSVRVSNIPTSGGADSQTVIDINASLKDLSVFAHSTLNNSVYDISVKTVNLSTNFWNLSTFVHEATSSYPAYNDAGDGVFYLLVNSTAPKLLAEINEIDASTNWYISKSGMYGKAYYAESDKNLKTQITSINYSVIPEIKEFVWKDTSAKSYGFIAQDLENQGYTELVSESDGIKKVNYNAALSLTVGMLMQKVNKLEKELEELKNSQK